MKNTHISFLIDSTEAENVRQAHSSPVGAACACGAPAETDGLLHHVLLLPSVASTGQGSKHSDLRIIAFLQTCSMETSLLIIDACDKLYTLKLCLPKYMINLQPRSVSLE